VICLTVIARNEARCLARCLQSAAPYVDEMLVVDTGSTDDTRRIAVACGARLAEFAWIDDFSAARNYALAQTNAPWRLVLDADEWIEEGGACLRQALPADASVRAPEGTPDRALFVGEINIRSAFDDGGTVRFAPSWIARFLPKGLQFAGRIHEQVAHRLPVRRLPLIIGHDGYRRQQQEIKGDRNERLLRQQLLGQPGNAYLHYQLGKDLQVRDRHAEAIGEYCSARDRVGWPTDAAPVATALQAQHPWLHDLVVRELYCLKKSGDLAAALLYAQSQAPWWQHSPDFHFALGDVLLDCAMAEPRRAAELLPMIEASWMRCIALGETPGVEGAVEGRGSYLAAHNLAVMHEQLGNADKAEYFRAIGRNRP